MANIVLKLSRDLDRALQRHLLPDSSACEEAAFLFTHIAHQNHRMVFEPVEHLLVGPDGFVHRSPRFLELTDGVRAQVIKRAHDLGTAVVEFHSHPQYTPQFSWSDVQGLREFVPHVRWRLKGRPYGAVVVAPAGFDALFWVDTTLMPVTLEEIEVEGQVRKPTGWSLSNWQENSDGHGSL